MHGKVDSLNVAVAGSVGLYLSGTKVNILCRDEPSGEFDGFVDDAAFFFFRIHAFCDQGGGLDRHGWQKTLKVVLISDK